MKHSNPKFDVISALRLRGMTVIHSGLKVVQIDKPSEELRKLGVDIIENIKGVRRRVRAVQFHGVTVRWHEEQ